jgi:predicted secreted protein
MAAALVLIASGTAGAQEQPDPAASAVWRKVHASVFADAAIAPADGVLTLETPKRAEDAAVVPIAIRARFDQARERAIDRIWLIVDNNPSPIAAVFQFSPDSGRADIETRIRIEEYTFVRAVAATTDGKLYMAANYVKASGGCSAPAGKDALAAKANLGKMRLRVTGTPVPGQPVPPSERLGARDGPGHAHLCDPAFRAPRRRELCRQAGDERRRRLLDQRESELPLLLRCGRRRTPRGAGRRQRGPSVRDRTHARFLARQRRGVGVALS